MSNKYVWWVTSAVALLASAGAVAATGVSVHQAYGSLQHGQPFAVAPVQQPLTPVAPQPVDLQALRTRLDAVAEGNQAALGNFGGQVIDTATGEVIWQQRGTTPLVPASSTKALTVAAGVLSLGARDVITTQIVRGQQPGQVVIKSAGDVWMTLAQLDEVANTILAKEPEVTGVFIDDSVWKGPDQAPGWEPENVDAGFITPMHPTMVFGGRLGADTGDVPRSHSPSFDVARFLARRLGTQTVGESPAPEGAEVLAQITSPTFENRAQQALKRSDNVMAEAIGREVALARGKEASFKGATQATLEVLKEHGVDITGVNLEDNSGLSTANRIPADTLAQVFNLAARDETLRPLVGYLPVAGGDGTLYTRYADLPGRGYVRAKTGTLTATSALAGTAQGQSGHIYAFAFLVNDGDIVQARRAQDLLASALREF